MYPEYGLDVDEFNLVLIIFSATVVFFALIALILMYCTMSCGCCRRQEKRRKLSNIPQVMVTQHRDNCQLVNSDCGIEAAIYVNSQLLGGAKKESRRSTPPQRRKIESQRRSRTPSSSASRTPLSIDCPDLDYIDARNTNLVSSTVQVDSVHQTPTLS